MVVNIAVLHKASSVSFLQHFDYRKSFTFWISSIYSLASS